MSRSNPLKDVPGGNPFSDPVNDNFTPQDTTIAYERPFAQSHPNEYNGPVQGRLPGNDAGFQGGPDPANIDPLLYDTRAPNNDPFLQFTEPLDCDLLLPGPSPAYNPTIHTYTPDNHTTSHLQRGFRAPSRNMNDADLALKPILAVRTATPMLATLILPDTQRRMAHGLPVTVEYVLDLIFQTSRRDGIPLARGGEFGNIEAVWNGNGHSHGWRTRLTDGNARFVLSLLEKDSPGSYLEFVFNNP